MKKIKIMLLSLALLAVVGGALAFKAKFSGLTYCTAAVGLNGTCGFACPNYDVRLTDTEEALFKCTTDPTTYTYGSEATSTSFGCKTAPGWQSGNYNLQNLNCQTSAQIKAD